MSKWEKLYEQALRNPGSIRFSDIRKLLLGSGFSERQAGRGTSHHYFTRGSTTLSIPKQGSDGVKPFYVKQAMAALEMIRLAQGEDDDDEE